MYRLGQQKMGRKAITDFILYTVYISVIGISYESCYNLDKSKVRYNISDSESCFIVYKSEQRKKMIGERGQFWY